MAGERCRGRALSEVETEILPTVGIPATNSILKLLIYT